MNHYFDNSFFRNNRDQLRNLFSGTAPIVLTANGQLQRSADATFQFSQDPSFWYLTGINQPDVLVVLDKQKEYIILPERSDVQKIFDGEEEVSALQKISGITEILNRKDGMKRLSSRLKRAKHMATLAPGSSYIDVYGMYTNPARQSLVNIVKEENPDIKILDLRKHLAQLRMIKQPQEIEAIKRAIHITSKSIKQLVKRGFDRFPSAFAIETELIRLFRNNGADGEAFDSVIASGDDTCIIHVRPTKSELSTKGPLLLDVGASVDGYAADISRTYFLEPATKRQRQIYETVLEVQSYAYNLLKPGVIIIDYEKQIERFMGEKLRELGLIKTIEHDTVRKYFPHATSHHLGLDVHDVADYDKPLQKNMVLTVEPGIYVPEEGIGVRIEDDIIITRNGNKILTSGLSTQL